MKRKIHNYTSNLEVTSLLIRIKNLRNMQETLDDLDFDKSVETNNIINKYILWHTRISDKTYGAGSPMNVKKRKLLDTLKSKIISMSEQSAADKHSYDRFGSIVLLMIKKILTKSQFSGYSYKDDFYSDATYKILKYLGNFDHTMISKRSGEPVNAFAYLTQIIHNSIIFIIGSKKKEQEHVQQQAKMNFLESLPAAKDTRNLYFANTFKELPQEKAIKHLYYQCINGTEVLTEVKEFVKSIQGIKNYAFENVFLHFAPETTFSALDYADLCDIIRNSNGLLKFGNRVDSIIYDEDNIIIKDE